jgi:hypothetical protein
MQMSKEIAIVVVAWVVSVLVYVEFSKPDETARNMPLLGMLRRSQGRTILGAKLHFEKLP